MLTLSSCGCPAEEEEGERRHNRGGGAVDREEEDGIVGSIYGVPARLTGGGGRGDPGESFAPGRSAPGCLSRRW